MESMAEERLFIDELRAALGTAVLAAEERRPRRIYLFVEADHATQVAWSLFNDHGARLVTISGFDARGGIELLYHLSFDGSGVIVTVRTLIPGPSPKIASLGALLPAASWIEREIADLFGVEFEGHPNPERLILPDDWPDGVYPLRRSTRKEDWK